MRDRESIERTSFHIEQGSLGFLWAILARVRTQTWLWQRWRGKMAGGFDGDIGDGSDRDSLMIPREEMTSFALN